MQILAREKFEEKQDKHKISKLSPYRYVLITEEENNNFIMGKASKHHLN